MYIYLPIAEQPINAFIVLGIGWLVGIIMGMVGIGGGFLLTPLMIFFGIPSPVAVASVANQLVAPSVSGVLSHWKSGNVDFKMGTILLVGGVIGSSIGVLIFNILNAIGQLDLVIKLSYVIFLAIIGSLMLIESLKLIVKISEGSVRDALSLLDRGILSTSSKDEELSLAKTVNELKVMIIIRRTFLIKVLIELS